MVCHGQLEHIALAVHSPKSKERFMLLFTSYADETGHSDDPNFHFVGMAGFVAPLEVGSHSERRGKMS